MKTGYWRDYDSWLYLTSIGDFYYVDGPDTIKPPWQKLEPPVTLGDAVPKTPDPETLARFERLRIAYGIPA
jgi:hypothetical protein